MKNTKSISIGLSVFNEANNISSVLNDILAQKRSGFYLEEILVFDDGSTDKTVEIVKSMKNKKIKIIQDDKRIGKTQRLNQMLRKFRGDILIMFDGDIRLASKLVVLKLIEPFGEADVMLVGGNSMPYAPKSFFQKAVYSTFNIFYKSRKNIKNGNNIFGATGSILAVRKKFGRTIKMPKIINEDTFMYLSCIADGYKFVYVDKAVVFYKLPQKISDYVKQVFRSDPRAATFELNKYFGELVEQEFHRPVIFYFRSIFEEFILNPIGLLFIIGINLFCKIFTPLVIRNYKLDWFTAGSTH